MARACFEGLPHGSTLHDSLSLWERAGVRAFLVCALMSMLRRAGSLQVQRAICSQSGPDKE